MRTEHTPGPWVADTENPWPQQIGCCPLVGRPFAIGHGPRNVAAASTAADARLIAAAPDMLEALQMLTGNGRIPPTAKAFWKARMAIDKATKIED